MKYISQDFPTAMPILIDHRAIGLRTENTDEILFFETQMIKTNALKYNLNDGLRVVANYSVLDWPSVG